ncbi:hypothetical protein [Streptomyces erythrochromogenes]|uniref:hypothetical protein n=1 Tax=Streptomyces erythrochromogenes TaxID=285574 RepID=UPI00225BC47A|nr:hypothetical protein [Streptomyces erythrochromogenes]MCX5582877.1 hypothetical protein [Streptomyces erythrochromogenes]
MNDDNEYEGHVDPRDLLLRTDWNAVEHCCPDVAPATPVMLLELLDDDPGVQGWAFRALVEAHTRQQVFYTATAPAARFVAAVLGDARTLRPVTDRVAQEEVEFGPQAPFPLRAGLLAWLGDSVVEALAQRERPYGDEEDLEAFLDLAPEFHAAARPFLDDGGGGSPEVREAALGVLLAVLRLPALADGIPGHRDLVRATALGDGPHRLRAVDTLSSWGEEVSHLL